MSKICHVNAQNTGYLVLYLAFCFVLAQACRNFSLKYLRTQELSYI